MDILYLLDRLEEELTGGRHLPLVDRTLIDEQECLDILDQIRVAIPEEIKAARRVTQDREQMLDEARNESERLLREAEQQVTGRVADHALARAAETRAAEIEDRAMRQADQIRREADDYAYRVLEKLRQQLQQVNQSVERGMKELAPEQAEDGVVASVSRRN